MNITFKYDALLPELIISGPELAENGFTPGVSVGIYSGGDNFYIKVMTDEREWEDLLNSPDASEGADVIQEDGTLYIGGSWLEFAGNGDGIKVFIEPGSIAVTTEDKI